MAGDKTYITDDQGKLHRATRVHAVTPTDIVWSSNPNDYTVQVKIDGKWHRAILTMDAGSSTFFDNINIDKALVTGTDGKQHTALIVKPESTVTLSDIKTDTHGTIAGTTTGETAVSTYSENWSNVKWQDNVNVYKVLVTGSDGKVHTALLTTGAGGGGGVQVIVLGPSPLLLPDAIANSLSYVKAFGGTEQGVPDGYTLVDFIMSDTNSYIETDISANDSDELDFYWHTDRTGTVFAFSQGVSANNAAFQITNSTSATPPGVLFTIQKSNYVVSTGVSANTNAMVHIQIINKEIFIDGVSYGTSGGTLTAPTEKLRLFCSTAGVSSVSYMGRFTVKGKIDLFPCTRDSDGAVGFYDAISGTFLTNAGTGTLTAGLPAAAIKATPDNPVQIISNNGVLKYSLNMANVNAQTILLGYYISAQGVVTADTNNWIYQDYIPVSPNTTYTLTMSSPVYYVSISEYSTADDSGFVIRKAGSTGTNTTLTITTGATTNFIRFGTNIDRTEVTLEEVLAINWQLNKGSSMPYTPYSPTGIYTDGTVETINAHGKNLNGGGALDHQGYTSTGGTSTSTTFCGTLWKIKVKPGEKYTISYGNFPDGVSGVFINTWLTDGTWNLRQAIAISGSYTYTVPAGVGEVNFTLYKTGGVTIASNSWLQVEKGETATTYEPYYDGGTATAEMLLKVGNYQDQQEILSGAVTRNVGVMVLDGTESWQLATATNLVQFYTSDTQGIIANNVSLTSTIAPYGCTAANRTQYDFGCYSGNSGNLCFQMKGSATLTTVSAWTQYLAAQYAAGTPVIVIYPLATATTESVAGQTLQVQAGGNTLEITQASLSDLELEAEYTKVA